MAVLGWIGLGDIGTPMCERLLAAGHDMLVWGRSRDRVERAAAGRCEIVASPAELGRRCTAVFLCVTDADAAEAVVFGEQGVASGSAAQTLVVDTSTVGPLRTRAMAERLRQAGRGRWVDAPVSGGAVGARAGTLAAMVGGEPEDVAAARPYIAAFAGKITHVGPAGFGQMCKVCNQVIANTTIMVWAETLSLAERFGIAPETLMEAAEGGFADSSVRKVLGPMILSGGFPGIYAPLIPKDMDLAGDVAGRLGAPVPLAGLVLALYRQHGMLAAQGTAMREGIRGIFAPASMER